MSDEVIQVRDAEPGDLAFIYSTTLRELRSNDPSPLPDSLYFPPLREYWNRVLGDPAVKVLVLCPSDARREILGYVVARPFESVDSPGALFWVYVKPRYRNEYGLCRKLLQSVNAEMSPAAFSTRLSRQKLKNPPRSRSLRPLYQDPRAA